MNAQPPSLVNSALQIVRWAEVFESCESRRYKTLTWFASPAGCDSGGFLELASLGRDGMTALGIFQSLCQAYASHCRSPGLRDGIFRRSNGQPMTVRQIATLIRVDTELLEWAIPILSSLSSPWLTVYQTGDKRVINGCHPESGKPGNSISPASPEEDLERGIGDAALEQLEQQRRSDSPVYQTGDTRLLPELQESTTLPARAREGAGARTRDPAPEIPGAPSRAEVLAHAEMHQWPEECAIAFFAHYESCNWTAPGFDPRRWKARFEKWMVEEYHRKHWNPAETTKKKKPAAPKFDITQPPPDHIAIAAALELNAPERAWQAWSMEIQHKIWQHYLSSNNQTK